MSDFRANLIRNLKGRRICLGISQMELAERAGISAGFVGEIETGRKDPSLVVLDHLASALGVQPYRLLMGPEDVAEMGGKEAVYEAVAAIRASVVSGLDATLRSLESGEGDATGTKTR